MSARLSSTEVLQATFPGRSSLSPKEIAQAIYGEGKDTKKRVEQINRALNEGRLVPGLRKDGARWRVPIAALGAAMDRRVQPVASFEPPTPTRRSRHSTIGPRMLFQQERSRKVLQLILGEIRALESQALERTLDAQTPPALGKSRKPDRP